MRHLARRPLMLGLCFTALLLPQWLVAQRARDDGQTYQRGAPTLEEVVTFLEGMPWRTLCDAAHRCPVVRVDTTVYLTPRPFLDVARDTVALILSPHDIARTRIGTHRVIAGGPLSAKGTGTDTAVVSVGTLVGSRGRPGERRMVARVMPPDTIFGYVVNCRLFARGKSRRVTKCWVEEE